MIPSEQASRFARLPMEGIDREYPHAQVHVLNGPEDVLTPRQIHPAFFGCYDWHSAVHGHWTLVRLLRYAELPEAAAVRALLGASLTPENLEAEARYFQAPNRQSFERMYGWAWLLKLAQELHEWADPDARLWRQAIRPLEQTIVDLTRSFLPKQTYPFASDTTLIPPSR